MRKNPSLIAVFLAAAWAAILGVAQVSAQSLMQAPSAAPAGGSGLSGAPVAGEPLDSGPGGLADFVDIQTGLPEGDLRSVQSSPDRLQRGSEGPLGSSMPQVEPLTRPSGGIWVPPVRPPSAPASRVISPIVSRETQARVLLAPNPAEVRDAVASPSPAAAANLDGQAALMSVFFDRAQLQDPNTPLRGETVSGSSQGRLAASPISSGRIPGLRAAPEPPGGAARPSPPSQAPAPSPRKPDMSVGQLVSALGGALGTMTVDAAGAAVVSLWYAPRIDFQGYRAIFGRKDVGAARKAAYSVLLPVATLLAVGLAPFAGGLWGLAHGWIEGKDRGFRFAIQGAREDVRMFRKNAGRIETLAQELADDASRSLGLTGAGSKAAAASSAEAPRRLLPTIAGTIASASILALLLAAVLYVVARLLLAI